MIERLIIRLASQALQKNQWLIWSGSENKVIDSGEVENAEQLNLLTEKAQQCEDVVCLLPGCDITIMNVAIKGVLSRQIEQALPYLVEDELASDVENLHFTVIAKQTDTVDVAICDKQKISMWLSWLEAANICCRQFIPEGMTLPVTTDGKWQAVQLDEQWVVREDQNNAWSCEQEMLDIIIASKSDDELTPQIESYSSSAEIKEGEWFDLPPVSAMEIFSKGTKNNKINILSGKFKAKKEKNQLLAKWKLPIIIASSLFLLLIFNLYLKNALVEKETLLVKQQVEVIYQQAFPLQSKLKYARIKKKLKSLVASLEGNVDSSFLSMVNELVPAFANAPEFKVNSMKFDSKKQDLQISASADSFQLFESVNSALSKNFNIEQGALSNTKEGVSGLLTVRNK